MVMAILGWVAAGTAAVLWGHESPVLVAIAVLVGLLGVMVLRVAWNCAYSSNALVARVIAASAAGACGLLLLFVGVGLVVGSGEKGLVTDTQLAGVFAGETKTEVHHALGKPARHWLSTDVPGEDCDAYDTATGWQGDTGADVCYLSGKVDRVLPFG